MQATIYACESGVGSRGKSSQVEASDYRIQRGSDDYLLSKKDYLCITAEDKSRDEYKDITRTLELKLYADDLLKILECASKEGLIK